MPSVRARCERACRWSVERRRHRGDPSGTSTVGSTTARFGLRAGRSARLASAFSICRAFWKSPRHSSAVPWQASPYASSAVVVSSAITTLLGRRRAALRAPARRCAPRRPRLQCTTRARSSTLELSVLPAVAARLLDRIFLRVRDDLALGRGDGIDAERVAQPDQVQQNVGDLLARRRLRGRLEVAAVRFRSSTGRPRAVRPPRPTTPSRGSWANGTDPSRARRRRPATLAQLVEFVTGVSQARPRSELLVACAGSATGPPAAARAGRCRCARASIR